jgi:hypothetical protein
MILVKEDNLPADHYQREYIGGPLGTEAGDCYDKRGHYELMGENSSGNINRQMIWLLHPKKIKVLMGRDPSYKDTGGLLMSDNMNSVLKYEKTTYHYNRLLLNSGMW